MSHLLNYSIKRSEVPSVEVYSCRIEIYVIEPESYGIIVLCDIQNTWDPRLESRIIHR